jgi:hypothetical protein
LPQTRRAVVLQRAFAYWRHNGFPYYDIPLPALLQEFACLAAQPPKNAFRPSGLLGSVVGLRIANMFHPQMWSVCVSRYLSPMEVFSDDEMLKAALARSWLVWPQRFGANASCLRRMLKTFPGAAGVSNFRPTLARAVIARYSAEGSTVVDFAAGYGGRLVGALTLPRHYVGVEPASQQVRGLRRTVATLTQRGRSPSPGTAEIIHGCAEEILCEISSCSADLVFSSPPYHDWERYSEEQTQSYRRYRSYDDWLTYFLTPTISESSRILRKGATFIVNVSGGRRKPDAATVEAIARKAGLKLKERLPMLLARVPYLHPATGGPYKGEYLLVFSRSRSA